MSTANILKTKRVLRFLKPPYWLITGQFSRFARRAFPNKLVKIEVTIAKSGVFDEALYMRNSPSCGSTGLSPIQHYLRHGITEGKEPCALFNTGYYLSQFESEERKTIKYPLHHYITIGANAGKNPHPLFDSSYYYSKMYLEGIQADINPLGHFLTNGYKTHNSPHPFFDSKFYLNKYPDIAQCKLNPLIHYVQFGWKEDRDPSSNFSAQDYKELYPDVLGYGGSPLEHYVLYGHSENRITTYSDLITSDYLPVLALEAEEKYHGVVDVIVPVYRGLEETRRCIESVLSAKTSTAYRLVVINDRSPEPELIDYLEKLPQDDRLLVLHNPKNLGFVGTVNKGMKLDSTRDVILLNSDTLVPDFWLDRILSHSMKDPNVATITPVSNNATICSYPKFEGSESLPEGETVNSMNELCYAVNSGRTVEVPTGVGYCMYIRRESLNSVGYFDEEAFGKGYGEENDFCLRAKKEGWKNINALDVYVYHRGEVSFKEDGLPLKVNATAVLTARHPNYTREVSRFVTQNPSKPFRLAITARRLQQSSKPCVLLIEHALGGGTEKHTKEILGRFKDKVNYLILRPIMKGKKRNTILYAADQTLGLEIKFNSTTDFNFITEFLKSCGVTRAHIHHLLGFSLDVRELINTLNIPFDFTVHDYLTICPQKNLLDKAYHYCGEPEPNACNSCIAERLSSCASDIIYWRESSAWLIRTASRVICPSYDVAKRMGRLYPTGNYFVIPHEPTEEANLDDVRTLPNLRDNQRLRIGILGVLVQLKGYDVVKELASTFAQNKELIEFISIGYTIAPAPLAPAISFYQTGEYIDAELNSIIKKNDLHAIWFPTDCPETYSYTLSSALKTKLPIIAPRLGAFTERLTGRTNTWLVKPNRNIKWWTFFFKNLRANTQISNIGESELDLDSIKNQVCENFYEQEYLDFNNAEVKTTTRHVINYRQTINIAIDGKRDAPNSCGYIRMLLPLRNEKILKEFDVRTLRKSELKKAQNATLIAQRILLTDQESLECLRNLTKDRGVKFIYDIDDDLIDLPKDHPEKEHYDLYRHGVIEQLRLADQVWVSTPSLFTKLTEYNQHTTLRPNYIDETLWLSDKLECPGAWLTPKIKILYMGTFTHQTDYAVVKGALQRIHKEFGDSIEFCVIGVSKHLDEEKWYTKIPIPHPACSSYPAFVHWLRSINDFSIGIAPLVDSDFNRSKSGLKFLDYSALGLCSICSDVESYRGLVNTGENGFLVKNTEEEWYEAIKHTIVDRQTVRRIRLTAHRELREKHTIGANIDSIINLLRSL